MATETEFSADLSTKENDISMTKGIATRIAEELVSAAQKLAPDRSAN
jgi:hypothetical protein